MYNIINILPDLDHREILAPNGRNTGLSPKVKAKKKKKKGKILKVYGSLRMMENQDTFEERGGSCVAGALAKSKWNIAYFAKVKKIITRFNMTA